MRDLLASTNPASICGDQGYLGPVTWSTSAQAIALARELAATAELETARNRPGHPA
jgi:hypothetical protein